MVGNVRSSPETSVYSLNLPLSFFSKAAMKLEQEVQGLSRETSGPWGDWSRDQEHKQCSHLSLQFHGMMREETGRASQ